MTALIPEYIGGPLCGDPAPSDAVGIIFECAPMVGKTTQAKGAYTYRQNPAGDFVCAAEDPEVTS